MPRFRPGKNPAVDLHYITAGEIGAYGICCKAQVFSRYRQRLKRADVSLVRICRKIGIAQFANLVNVAEQSLQTFGRTGTD